MANAPATPSKSSTLVEIERLGLKYSEVAQYDLTNLSEERRVQVRDPLHYARREDIERYAVMMEMNIFPPIVVTSDAWIVDGNTRIGAALKRKQHHFPAIVLDRPFNGSSEQHINELFALAATLNSQSGQPLTPAERRINVKRFLDLGWTFPQIGRAIGLRQAVITGVRKELDAQAKLKRVGMSTNGELNGTSLRALGTDVVVGLNDEPFRTLATLAVDAGLNMPEIVAAAKAVKETGSDEAGIARIQQLRAENEERIRQRALTGTGKPPIARMLRQHLGFVVKYANDTPALIEHNPAVAGQHALMLEQAIGALQATLDQQRATSQSN